VDGNGGVEKERNKERDRRNGTGINKRYRATLGK
jgi:hypothetical protein